MYYNFKLYLLFVAVATGVMGDIPEKIVSGQYSTPTEIPYIASIRTNGRHFCGGSIISYYHILTAAHCLIQKNSKGSSFVPGKSYVVTGTTMIKYNGTSHKIRNYNSHPYFKLNPANRVKYDIAIITVNKKIEMNDHQKIIRLPVSPLPARSAGTTAGWGDMFFQQKQGSHMLLKLETTVMNGKECNKYRSHDRDTQSIICSLVQSGRGGGACNGDSGGPLVVGNALVGIVSHTTKCASGSPDVFTSVHFYKGWIQQTLNLSGVAGVNKFTPQADFYNKDKVKRVPLKYIKPSQYLSSSSKIVYYSYQNGEWFAVVY